MTHHAESVAADLAYWKKRAEFYEAETNRLHEEIDRLSLEVMAHQVGDGYEKGYEHGLASGLKHAARSDGSDG